MATIIWLGLPGRSLPSKAHIGPTARTMADASQILRRKTNSSRRKTNLFANSSSNFRA